MHQDGDSADLRAWLRVSSPQAYPGQFLHRSGRCRLVQLPFTAPAPRLNLPGTATVPMQVVFHQHFETVCTLAYDECAAGHRVDIGFRRLGQCFGLHHIDRFPALGSHARVSGEAMSRSVKLGERNIDRVAGLESEAEIQRGTNRVDFTAKWRRGWRGGEEPPHRWNALGLD